MNSVVILDTTILLNVLNVPGKADQREQVIQALNAKSDDKDTLLLPWVVVVETAGHILRASRGDQRRQCANFLKDIVMQATQNEAPWTMIKPPSADDLQSLMENFPDCAMRGISIVDSDIIREYNVVCELNPRRHVLIWSLDGHLQGYSRPPIEH